MGFAEAGYGYPTQSSLELKAAPPPDTSVIFATRPYTTAPIAFEERSYQTGRTGARRHAESIRVMRVQDQGRPLRISRVAVSTSCTIRNSLRSPAACSISLTPGCTAASIKRPLRSRTRL